MLQDQNGIIYKMKMVHSSFLIQRGKHYITAVKSKIDVFYFGILI